MKLVYVYEYFINAYLEQKCIGTTSDEIVTYDKKYNF